MIWVKLFYSAKFFEVLCEAFPQSVLGIYMVLVLQQQEILNWMSISISVVSLIYGVAESVTTNTFGATAPFLKVVLSSLSGIIDTSFRVLFISYFSSLSSSYSLFFIPMVYILAFYLTLSIKAKNFKLTFFEFQACLLSLPSSTYEEAEIKYTLRPISKLVFNVLASLCLCLTTGRFWEEYPRLEPKVLPFNATYTTNATVFDYSAYCQNVCNITDISICSTFNQSEDVYHGLLITLWVLLVLSTLEGILERFVNVMPHCKFLEPIQREDEGAPDGSKKGVELQQRDIPPEV